jgi:5-methylthioribose kinase
MDIEQPDELVRYLKARGAIGGSEQPAVRVLGGGVSNRVVLVVRGNGDAWVLKQALPKLRVAVDWFSSPERVHREAAALRWLTELRLPVPALRFEDFDQHLLAMDAVQENHQNWKTMLLAGHLEMAHIDAFAQILADIHTRSRSRNAEIELAFADRSFFESLRIEPYYEYTAEQVPAARSFLADVVSLTRANGLCLVHGDFSPKNVLVRGRQFVLLDHEVAHYGDPAFDIGFSMAHLLSKAHHIRDHRARFQDAAIRYWTMYWRQVGSEDWSEGLEYRSVRSILGCLLARVAGRSTLEYLGQSERQTQQRVVLALMAEIPDGVPALVSRFVGSL